MNAAPTVRLWIAVLSSLDVEKISGCASMPSAFVMELQIASIHGLLPLSVL